MGEQNTLQIEYLRDNPPHPSTLQLMGVSDRSRCDLKEDNDNKGFDQVMLKFAGLMLS